MRTEDTRILVIDDDSSQLSAIGEYLTRLGYEVVTVLNGEDAILKCRAHEFHIVVSDLLLPKVNGLDLAQTIAPTTSSICKFIFISGVFKDKQLIKRAMDKIPILGFLPKPIHLEELKGLIEDHLKPYLTDSKPPLYSLMSQSQPTKNEIMKALNDTQVAHGYDLPFIYSLLLNYKLNGTLNVITAEGEIFSVNVQNGQLAYINLKDSETYFGALLIEMGFNEQDEVDTAVAADPNKKIGQKLVDVNALSPHVIEIIKKQQLKIRLSKSTLDSTIEISFTEGSLDISDDYSLNVSEFQEAIHDIVLSKVNAQWLKTHYTPWYEHALIGTKNIKSFFQDHADIELLKPFGKLLKVFDGQAPLTKILDANLKFEERLLKAIHFLIISDQLYFTEEKVNSKNVDVSIQRYKNLLNEMNSQNHFQILGVSQYTTPQEIARSYHELAKVLHPDKLPAGVDKEIYELVDKIFSLISEAYTALKQEDKRAAYVASLQFDDSAELLKNEQLLSKGIESIKKHRYLEAYNVFESISLSKNKPSDINIYLVWATLQSNKKSKSKSLVEKCTSLLNEIPTEDRQSPDYYFVKGLIFKKRGQFDKAKSAFENTLGFKPTHSFAKKELSKIKVRIQHRAEIGNKTLFVDLDVGEALTHIFSGKNKKIKKIS